MRLVLGLARAMVVRLLAQGASIVGLTCNFDAVGVQDVAIAILLQGEVRMRTWGQCPSAVPCLTRSERGTAKLSNTNIR